MTWSLAFRPKRPVTGEVDTEGSVSTMSRHSSPRGPHYKKGMKVRSFPTYNLASLPPGHAESYVRSLSFSGHGYPPWEIVGNEKRTKDHVRRGYGIGDVGVLIGAGGEFDYYFNILSDEGDPIHYQGTPAKFKPLRPTLDPTEIRSTPNFFQPGTALVSKGVETTRLSESPLDLTFSSSAREGGILLLENGATREDLISTERIRIYLKEHALDIYRYMNNYDFDTLIAPNGSLYVLTGCDRASTFKVAFFPTKAELSGKPVSLTHKDGKWDHYTQRGFFAEELGGGIPIDYSSVFLRGIRVALSQDLWAQHVSMRPPQDLPYCNVLTNPIVGIRSRIGAKWESLVKTIFNRYPVPPRMSFHPSNVLLEILLLVTPQAQMAMVEDSVWQSAADGSEGTLSQIKSLTKKVFQTHEIRLDDGVVTLFPRPQIEPLSFKDNFIASIKGKKKTPEQLAISKLSGFFSARLCKCRPL